MTAVTSILGGVIGMVDLSMLEWEKSIELNRHWLNGIALPGVAEQSWKPEFRTISMEHQVRIGRPTPVLAGSAGVWSPTEEYISDTLDYINETVERTRLAGVAGASFALVPTPKGLKPQPGQMSQALIYRYFRDVQAKSALPLVIHQPRELPDSYKLEPDSILSLVRLGRIVGLIMEDGTEADFSNCVRAGRRADFTVLCGREQFPQAIHWGARGVALPVDDPALPSIAASLQKQS